ncbi:hypothetical protein MC885_005356, partial [Smutsia gigantea]
PRDSGGWGGAGGGAVGVFLPRPREAPWKGRGLRVAPLLAPGRSAGQAGDGRLSRCEPTLQAQAGRLRPSRAGAGSQLRPPQPRDKEVARPASQFRFGGKSQQRAKTSRARSKTSWGQEEGEEKKRQRFVGLGWRRLQREDALFLQRSLELLTGT